MLTLPKYIEELGDERAAEELGVKLRTVQSWRRRERYPRPEQAREIVRRTNGRVGYAGIFADDSPSAAEDRRSSVDRRSGERRVA